VVGLERGPLHLVSTTEELLDRKVAAPVYYLLFIYYESWNTYERKL
jgi:hypothetical protein